MEIHVHVQRHIHCMTCTSKFCSLTNDAAFNVAVHELVAVDPTLALRRPDRVVTSRGASCQEVKVTAGLGQAAAQGHVRGQGRAVEAAAGHVRGQSVGHRRGDQDLEVGRLPEIGQDQEAGQDQLVGQERAVDQGRAVLHHVVHRWHRAVALLLAVARGHPAVQGHPALRDQRTLVAAAVRISVQTEQCTIDSTLCCIIDCGRLTLVFAAVKGSIMYFAFSNHVCGVVSYGS